MTPSGLNTLVLYLLSHRANTKFLPNESAAANSRSIGAGTAPNPGRYPGFCELPSSEEWSAITSITT